MLLKHDAFTKFTTEELKSAISYHMDLKKEMTDSSYDFQRKWNDELIESMKAEIEYRAK